MCNCEKTHASFSDAWKKKLVADTGDHYLEPDALAETRQHAVPARSKLTIRGVAA